MNRHRPRNLGYRNHALWLWFLQRAMNDNMAVSYL